MEGNKIVIKNTIMLYGFSIAKIVFPLLTLPYLTRVLMVDTYGVVTYTKSITTYMQLIVDFGFILSATKDIVEAKIEGKSIGNIIGSVLIAQSILVILSLIGLIIIALMIPMLHGYFLFVILSSLPIILSTQLYDYVFRGIEKMEITTIRFILMKGISTLLIFVFVKNDADILLIPIFDTLGLMAAAVLVKKELKKLGIKIEFSGIKSGVEKLKESSIYFLSNIATTAFGALNTVLIGIYLSSSDVAYWGVCEQLIGGAQMMYNPIINGIYPEMIKNKNINYIKKIFMLFMPIVIGGCVFTFFVSKTVLTIVGGEKYAVAAFLLRMLIPVLLFSFPGMMLGWPTLGAIGHATEVTKTTIAAAVLQLTGIIVLIILSIFNLRTLAILRCTTELVLLSGRFIYVIKLKNEFTYT